MTAQSEWARCRHWIVDALEAGPGLETIEDIERKVSSGAYMLWAGVSSAAITDGPPLQRGGLFSILYAGGDLQSLKHELVPTLKNLCSNWGCDLAIVGRKGWEREMKSEGFEYAATLLVMKISHARTMN